MRKSELFDSFVIVHYIGRISCIHELLKILIINLTNNFVKDCVFKNVKVMIRLVTKVIFTQ